MTNAIDILKKYWGYSSFRPPQEAIIEHLYENRDVLAVLPTGYGKSLCFQIPTLLKNKGVCLVISPLVALINDQIKQLKDRGIKAIAFTGALSLNESTRLLDNVKYGGVSFMYIAPERLKSNVFQEQISTLPINLIVIDEAHCISEWGHDFRPSYLDLHLLRDIFPKVPMAAFTATATPQVQEDIVSHLSLKNPIVFKRASVRQNIRYAVLESQDKQGALLNYLKTHKGATIIYVNSRKMAEKISDLINYKGFKSCYYHAGLSAEFKQKNYELWMTDKTPIMVATTAFGMGIDKANVRSIIHMALPSSIENYIQESGRAGRDGEISDAVIIEEPADYLDSESIYIKSQPTADFIANVYNNLNQYFTIAYGELSEEPHIFEINRFCNQYKMPILKTFYSLEILEREGILLFNTSQRALHQIKILIDNEYLFDYYHQKKIKERLIKTILRNYGLVFDRYVTINPMVLAKKSNLTYGELIKQLNYLKKDHIIDYKYGDKTSEITFLVPREDSYTLSKVRANVKKRLKHNREKYVAILGYIGNTDMCRQKQLAQYFGEYVENDCEVCDVCVSKKSKKVEQVSLKSQVINHLKLNPNINEKDLILAFNNTKQVIDVIRSLIDDGLVNRQSDGQLQWKTK